MLVFCVAHFFFGVQDYLTDWNFLSLEFFELYDVKSDPWQVEAYEKEGRGGAGGGENEKKTEVVVEEARKKR